MSRPDHTFLVRTGGFIAGAGLDYLYLAIADKVTSNNLIFLVFFSGIFAALINELVGEYSLFGLRTRRLRYFLQRLNAPKPR